MLNADCEIEISIINLKFDGNQTEWENIRDLFISIVHDISQTKKMHYLSLKGEMAKIIANIF